MFVQKQLCRSLNQQIRFGFAKKQKMELTIRTPYRTLVSDFDGFQRVITKTDEAALVIQNRSPPSLYILPPGEIKLKLTQEVEGLQNTYMHTGGWCTVHADNTCEINLTDVIEKQDIKVDQFDKVELTEKDDVAGKYMSRLRRTATKIFTKKVAS